MSSEPSTAAVRASALALLASGNSLDSVAHVFEVPVDTLRSWIVHPAADEPAPAPPVDAPAHLPFWYAYPKTAAYEMGTMSRYVGFALVPLLLAGPVFAWPFVFDGVHSGGAGFVLLLVSLALLTCAACAVRYVLHARFELRPHAISARMIREGRSVPLAHIEALTATRQSRSTFYAVALHLKGGQPPLKIYPDYGHLRDDDLLAWLTSIPQRGGDAIRRPAESSPATSLALNAVIGLVTLFGVFDLSSAPIDAARAMWSGYPPLARLSLVEGTLVGVSRCHPGGKGYSAYLPITLSTPGGMVQEAVGCDLAPALRARDIEHHVSVWRDKRRFADGLVREVDMDGRVLKSYADYIASSRPFAPFNLLGQSMLASAILLFCLGFILSSRED